MYDYKGIFHIHTTHSGDSLATLPLLVAAARKTGTAVIAICDHNKIDAKAEEGYHRGVLVLVGEEVSPPGGNHYLAFQVTEPVRPLGPPQKVIDAVRDQGGFGFIAHPHYRGNPSLGSAPSLWTDWTCAGYSGIEILNYSCDGVRDLDARSLLAYTALPRMHPIRPDEETLRLWDSLGLPAIGSADAHLARVRLGPLKPYAHPLVHFFKGISTHILLDGPLEGDFAKDSEAVYRAIRTGSSYICNERQGDPTGAVFRAESRQGQAGPGGSLPLSGDGVVFLARSPSPALHRLFRDGKPVASAKGRSFTYTAKERGNYRLEVHRGDFPWIYFNPVRVT